MDRPIAPSSMNEINEFLLTPYKISLAVLIQQFTDQRNHHTQKEIGAFCILIMKLIQGLDLPYGMFLARLKSAPRLNQDLVVRKVSEKIEKMQTSGACHLLDLIHGLKSVLWINRSSFLGIFVRRLNLYFDKLSFSGVMRLFDDFKQYVSTDLDESDDGMLNESFIELDENEQLRLKFNVCPKQIQYFTSKQAQLLSLNEKRALPPAELNKLISEYEEQNKNQCVFKFDLSHDLFRRQTQMNDINYLKFLNNLRMKEYVAAKEALFSYFDGMSNSGSRCWPALNLAMFYFTFEHYNLSIEALKECVSTAQDANDERCLEYALTCIARVIIKQRSEGYLDEDILAILQHLQIKASNLELPHLAALASLMHDQLTGLQFVKPRNDSQVSGSHSLLNAELIAAKHSLTDLLTMAYMNKNAIFAQLGASNLMALCAQAMLHLHVVEMVGDELVFGIDENFALALSSMSYHIWKNMGEYEIARNMLLDLSTKLFSPYSTPIVSIWKCNLAKIDFEYHLNRNHYKEAQEAVDLITLHDRNEGMLRLAELYLKKADRRRAFDLVVDLLAQSKQQETYFRIRVLLLKAQILDDVASVFDSLNLAIEHKVKGLENTILIELCFQLNRIGQLSQSLRLIRSKMVHILTDLEQREVGKAFYLLALNQSMIIQRDQPVKPRIERRKHKKSESSSKQFASVLKNNSSAIEIFHKIGDVDFLKRCYQLQAEIYQLIGDVQKRNFYARKARLLYEKATIN